MRPIARIRLIAGIVLLVAAIIVVAGSTYAIDEAEQAVILQFGKPIGDPITEPGLHVKWPFIQEVRRFDKRLLSWDGDPNQIPTSGREFISVDTTARWRIVDPLQFLQSVTNQADAQSRLDDIIDSVVRDKVSSTDLVEIVRSANWEVTPEDLQRVDVVTTESGDKELMRQVEVGREGLTRDILQEASKAMPQYGIELVDVRIKRLNYIPDVRQQVYDRMISERQRIAEKYRSEGEGEASRIQGETSRQLAEIRSEAKRQAEIIRGEADAEATRIYSEAYNADPDFYAFLRTLESYSNSLDDHAVLIIGADTAYFRYLRTLFPEATPPEATPPEATERRRHGGMTTDR